MYNHERLLYNEYIIICDIIIIWYTKITTYVATKGVYYKIVNI